MLIVIRQELHYRTCDLLRRINGGIPVLGVLSNAGISAPRRPFDPADEVLSCVQTMEQMGHQLPAGWLRGLLNVDEPMTS